MLPASTKYIASKKRVYLSPLKFQCLHAKSPQSCPTLCDPMHCSPPGSSVHGILQAGILEWVAMPSSRGSSQPSDQTLVSCIACRFFTSEPPRKPRISVSLVIYGERKSVLASAIEATHKYATVLLLRHRSKLF